MKKALALLLTAFLSCPILIAQLEFGGGGNPFLNMDDGPCLSPQQRAIEWAQLQQRRAELIQAGKLKDRRQNNRSTQTTFFNFPIKKSPNSPYRGFWILSNYVDHDNSTGKEDYDCQQLTYDGHRGTDFATFPFPWEMMDNNDVEVVAAAKGVILEKRDGNFDKSCTLDNPAWNAVYVEHEDGTIAWYGHLKKNSLTSKALGDTVYPGDFLGYIGSSGYSSGPHLHFELLDTNGNLVDPYLGTCNPTTNTSLWNSQHPYSDPYLLHIQTGDLEPEYGNLCYGDEFPNRKDQFDPGDRIYYSIYVRDYDPFMTTTLRLIDPAGNVVDNWTHSPNLQLKFSYWWWSGLTNANTPQGEWVFEVDFDGETISHSFLLGNATALNEDGWLNLSIGPNPLRDKINISGVKGRQLNYSLLSIEGKQLLGGMLEEASINVSQLSQGMYILKLKDLRTGEFMSKRILKQ